MTIEYTLDKKDVNIFLSGAFKYIPSLRRIRNGSYIFILILGIYVVLKNDYPSTGAMVIGFIINFLLILIFVRLLSWIGMKLSIWQPKSMVNTTGILGKHTITLTDESVIEVTDVNENKDRWSGVLKVIDTDDYIYILNAIQATYIIPKRAFQNIETANDFFQLANKLHIHAKGGLTSRSS